MQADFLDASQRHWDDAERLFQAQRWANADQLYGIAAECGLKCLMRAFGMEVNSKNGSPTKELDRVHANKISARFESYRSGAEATGYVLSTPGAFDNWDISDRYAHQSNFDKSRAKGHQDGAQAVRDLIKKARYEGRL